LRQNCEKKAGALLSVKCYCFVQKPSCNFELYDSMTTALQVCLYLLSVSSRERERGFEHARLVSSTLWSLQKFEKRLLSVKCCCFVQKPSYIQF